MSFLSSARGNPVYGKRVREPSANRYTMQLVATMGRRKVLIGILLALVLLGLSPFLAKWLIYRSCRARLARLQSALQALEVPEALGGAKRNLETLTQFLEVRLPAYYSSWRAWLFRKARRLLSDGERDLAQLRDGADPHRDRRGTFLAAYASEIDGGSEPYFLDVPQSYDPSRLWPLVVQLHGYVGLGIPFQMGIPDHREDCLTLAPHGKGSIDYKSVAEEEVLRAVREVTRKYNIDPDRIYLQGHSMGATGSWSLAAHYPHSFASISVSAGNTDHTVWEKLWESPEAPPNSHLSALRKHLEDADSAITFAPNFLNTPAYCVHGEADDIVPVQHSRNMVQRLRAEQCDIDYREVSLAPHASQLLTSVSSQFRWLLGKRRPGVPKKLKLTCSRLRYARSHWIEIERFERLLQFAEVEVDAAQADCLTMRTRNVARLVLHHRAELFPKDGLRIELDGQTIQASAADWTRSRLFLVKEDDSWQIGSALTRTCKRSGLEGPIEDAMRSEFIVVYGTKEDDPVEAAILKREAEALQEQWRMRFGYPCYLKPDSQVTEDDIREANLVCYGRPDQNTIVARCKEALPFQFSPDGIHFGDQAYRGSGTGVKFCMPNPLNPDRYLVVFAACSWAGMLQLNNRFGNWFDWSAYENRNYFDYAIFDERTHSPETFVLLGYFDQDWSISPNYQFRGDASLRREALPWRAPKFTAPPAEPELVLSDLMPARVLQLLGAARFDASFNGRPLSIGDRTFDRGFGVKAPSALEFGIGGEFSTFGAWVGVDADGQTVTDHHEENNVLVFEVYGDGRLLAASDEVRCGSPPCRLECSIIGCKTLRLSVRQAEGRRWFLLSAAWGDPKLTRWPGHT